MVGKVKPKDNPHKYHCEDCRNAHSFHEIGADGRPFLCKCPYFKFSKFLHRDYCDNFQRRPIWQRNNS